MHLFFTFLVIFGKVSVISHGINPIFEAKSHDKNYFMLNKQFQSLHIRKNLFRRKISVLGLTYKGWLHLPCLF